MDDRDGYLDFITSENYKNQIDIWYRSYNINREKIELFYDFLTSLYNLVNETYLGNDVIVEEFDQKNHFAWCWDRTIDNFNKEKIFFKERGAHFEYFWNLFLEAFYTKKDNDEIVRIPDYLFKLFNFKHKKTRSELDILSELYKLLNLSLKK
jgi:hypothetical protein